MKKLMLMLAAGLMTFSMSLAMADDAKQPSEKQLAQRQRMKDCNASAKSQGLKGADRKTYIKSCLSGSVEPTVTAAASGSKKTAQQEKMKSCNADAKTKALKGADRKAFMKSCLSASSN